MEAKVKKWGNSLGLRIPKSFSAQTGIVDGSNVDIQLEGNKITIVPHTTNITFAKQFFIKICIIFKTLLLYHKNLYFRRLKL